MRTFATEVKAQDDGTSNHLSCCVSGVKCRNGEVYDGNIEYVAIVKSGYGDRFVPEIVEEAKEND